MAKSPNQNITDYLSTVIKVAGQEIKGTYIIRSIEVTKEVNKISYAEIIIRDGEPGEDTDKSFDASQDANFIPGKEVEIQVGYGGKNKSIFKGIIVSQRLRVRSTGSNLYLNCADKSIAMTIGRKSQYFLKSKDSDIISKVAKPSGVKTKVKATTVVHPEIVQYHSTDWDFILSRAEVNGQIILVDGGELTIGPPEVSGTPVIKVTYGLDLLNFDAEIDSRGQYTSVTCNAWDMKTQKMVKGESKEPTVNKHGNLKGKTMATDIGVKKPAEFHTSGAVSDKMLKEWANAHLLKSRMSRIRGDLTFTGSDLVNPGTLIEVAGLGKRFNGEAFVSRVKHVLNEGEWLTHAGIGLSNEFFIENSQNISTLPAGGMLPAIHGLQIGVVKKIEGDPDKESRILVDIPVISATGDGVWARLSSFYATADAGLFFMPEVGDEVILGFLNDDPRFPIIVGMTHSSKIKSPYEIDKKNNIKALVTKSKMKIEFDEEKKIIVIETPGGNVVTMDDDKKSITLADPNKNVVELSDKGISLTSKKDITIDATGALNLKAKGKITIDSKQDVALAGLNIEGAAKVGMKMAGNAKAEFTASGQVTVKGAMVMIN